MKKLGTKFTAAALILLMALTMAASADITDDVTGAEAQALSDSFIEALRQMKTDFTLTGKEPPEDIDSIIESALQNEPFLKCVVASVQWETKSSADSYELHVTASYTTTSEEQQKSDELIEKILADIIKPYMTDHEKIKAVHDWIVLNAQYDTSVLISSDYDLLTKGKGNCNGYAMLTYKMLTNLDIPNYLVFGKSREAHVWNLVKAGDYWFHMDTTWDDPVPDKKNTVAYDYYMLTDKEILADHSIESGLSLPVADKEYYKYLADLSKSSYNGYVYDFLLKGTGLDLYSNENVISSPDTLNKLLAEKTVSMPSKISVRLGKSLTERDAQNAMSELLKNNSISEINYDPMKPDKTGNANTLTMYLKYKNAPDRIETDLSDKVYNTATVVNFNVYAIYGSTKVKITDDAVLYPYNTDFLNITGGTMRFLDAGYQNLTFEYGGKSVEVTVTALSSKGFQHITDKKPDSQINVKVFDRYIDLSKVSLKPFIENGRTLVPLRAIFETLNCEVDWSDSEKSAVVKKGSIIIKIPANQTTVYVNGTEQTLDVPARLINGSISVPLRFISESINRTVVWDGDSSTVYIY